jgi:hypothetical protein
MPSARSRLECTLAAYVVCMIKGDAGNAVRLDRELVDLGAPRWLLDTIGCTRGRWPVSDDDRIDLIVGYAAKLTDAPDQIGDDDRNRLRAVGLTDFDIADLRNVVAYYNA